MSNAPTTGMTCRNYVFKHPFRGHRRVCPCSFCLTKTQHAILQPEEAADIIIPIHVITSSDHTSGSYGHGMRKVMSGAEERELMCESLELVDLP